MAEAGGLFICDAEEGDVSDWTSVTTDGSNAFTATSASLNNGSYGFEADFDGVSSDAYGSKTFTEEADFYVRFYFKMSSDFVQATWKDDSEICFIRDGGASLFYLRLRSRGAGAWSFKGYLNAPYVALGELTGIVVNTWYRIEIRYKGGDASTGGGEWWVDGTSRGSDYGQDTSAYAPDSVDIGHMEAVDGIPTAGSIYIDDVKADTSPVGEYSEAVTFIPKVIMIN